MTQLVEETIGQAPIFISDGNYSSKYPKANEFLEDGVPFLSAYNISDGRVIDEKTKYISEEQHGRLLKGHIKTGDVLIVTRGSLGKVARVPEDFDGANINAQLVLLRAIDNKIDQRFLYYLISEPSFRNQVTQAASGVAQPQLPMPAPGRV